MIESLEGGGFTLERAIGLAAKEHRGQTDKADEPYFYHPAAVLRQLEGEDAQMVGILHDVVEDTPITFEDLTRMGCPPKIIEALRLVTHPEDYQHTEEEYMEGIQRIADSGNQLAIDVKWADLTHNSDTTRIKNPTEKDFKRWDKYKRSKEILKPFVSPYLLSRESSLFQAPEEQVLVGHPEPMPTDRKKELEYMVKKDQENVIEDLIAKGRITKEEVERSTKN